MSALREIAAIFDVNTGNAQAGLRNLSGAIGGVRDGLAQAATTLVGTFAGAFSLHAAADFIKDQIELGSRLNDTADKLGVSTEELQKFQFAAKLSGVEAEGAAHGLGFLNKNMGLAIEGNKEAAETFAGLGIDLASVKNGSKTATDLLPQLADKFAGMGSDAERTAVSMKIFGRQGAALLPLLKQGAPALAKMSEEFEQLGGGMQADFIANADMAGDEINKLKFAFQGLKSRVAVEVLPTVTEWATKLSLGVAWVIKLTKETNLVKDVLFLAGVAGSVGAAKTAIGWAKVFGLFPSGNAGLVKTLVSMGTMGAIIAIVAGLALVFEDLWTGINGGDSALRSWLIAADGIEATDALFAQFSGTLDSIEASFEGMKPAVGSLAKSLLSLAIDPYFVTFLEYIVRLLGAAIAESLGFARALGNLAKFDGKGALKALAEGDEAAFGKKGFLGADAWGPAPAPSAFPRPVLDPSSDPSSPYYYRRDDAGAAAPQVTVSGTQTTIVVQGAGDPKAVAVEVANQQRNVFNEDKRNAVAALKVGAPDPPLGPAMSK